MNIRMVHVPAVQYKGSSVVLLPGIVADLTNDDDPKLNCQVAAMVISPPNTNKQQIHISALGPFPYNTDLDEQFKQVFQLIDLDAELHSGEGEETE